MDEDFLPSFAGNIYIGTPNSPHKIDENTDLYFLA
jgi:hypothetical protein